MFVCFVFFETLLKVNYSLALKSALLYFFFLTSTMINTRKKKSFIELKQKYFKGGYPDLNWELTVPHTAALPIELHPPFFT